MNRSLNIRRFCVLSLAFAGIAAGAATGSISGALKDPSGLVIAGATVVATNAEQGRQTKATTDNSGLYILSSLPVGTYTLEFIAQGFRSIKRSGIKIDADSALREDATLELAQANMTIQVTESAVGVETEGTQMGEVIKSATMTAVALNGRSYTDLLALQPGVVPMSTQTPDSIVMAGASVAIAPSGWLNPGNQSISGQREDANGFIVNDGDVKELMNGGS